MNIPVKSNQTEDGLFKEKAIVIAVHAHLPGGPGYILRDYLLKHKAAKTLFIDHPLLYLREGREKNSKYEMYHRKKLKKGGSTTRFFLPDELLYCKDFLYTVFWVVKSWLRYDLFVGIDPLNAFAGIFLKRLGMVKEVVYYSIDYFPVRFQNKLMNKIYHAIDKFCVRNADETWNVGSQMAKARMELNDMKGKDYERQYHVPIGIWFAQTKRKQFSQINKTKLIYAGHLIDYMGVDLIIKALPLIRKEIPRVTLEIIGSGEFEKTLKEMICERDLMNIVRIIPWMTDRKKFEARLADGVLGLAPFNTTILDDKVKNADPGKIKDYMAAGLPVVLTKAVINHKMLEKAGCALVIDYDGEAFASAVIRLLKNERLLRKYREHAIDYVKQFDWEEIFYKNFERVFSSIQ